MSRGTVRKYVYAAEARGYHQGDPTPPQGWKVFLNEVIPKPRMLSELSRTLTRLIRLNPEHADAYASRALAYTCLDMEAEAQQDINRAVELGFDRALLE